MIKVTVELYPYGEEEGKREISSFDIANDGTGTTELGNYMFRHPVLTGGFWKPLVRGHNRREDVEMLIYKTLREWYMEAGA